MSYDKQTWTSGETITAQKLNYMEDGIEDAGSGGDIFIVSVEKIENGILFLNKTWQEVNDAMRSGQLCAVLYERIFGGNYIYNFDIFKSCTYGENGYYVSSMDNDFVAETADTKLYSSNDEE